MPTFILDGYNLAREMLSPEEMRMDLEKVRESLEARLRRFVDAGDRRTRVCLVYDGSTGLTGPASRRDRLEVLFSRPPQRADDVILDLCRANEGKGEVHVVTSDWRDIGERVGGLRVHHWRSAEFAAHVATRLERLSGRGAVPSSAEKPPPPRPEDAAGWVQEFGLASFPDEGREDRP